MTRDGVLPLDETSDRTERAHILYAGMNEEMASTRPRDVPLDAPLLALEAILRK